jgi:hypothetical protein
MGRGLSISLEKQLGWIASEPQLTKLACQAIIYSETKPLIERKENELTSSTNPAIPRNL